MLTIDTSIIALCFFSSSPCFGCPAQPSHCSNAVWGNPLLVPSCSHTRTWTHPPASQSPTKPFELFPQCVSFKILELLLMILKVDSQLEQLIFAYQCCFLGRKAGLGLIKASQNFSFLPWPSFWTCYCEVVILIWLLLVNFVHAFAIFSICRHIHGKEDWEGRLCDLVFLCYFLHRIWLFKKSVILLLLFFCTLNPAVFVIVHSHYVTCLG